MPVTSAVGLGAPCPASGGIRRDRGDAQRPADADLLVEQQPGELARSGQLAGTASEDDAAAGDGTGELIRGTPSSPRNGSAVVAGDASAPQERAPTGERNCVHPGDGESEVASTKL